MSHPKSKWKEEVIKDLEKIVSTNWKKKTQERKVWKRIVTKATGQLGLEC
jgi:hypothetical protein